MITLQKNIKRFFFDRKIVVEAVNKATLKALSNAGAFIRTRARSSMRRRKGISSPGQPPSVHAGQLKDRLYFAYDPSARSVVVGPERYAKAEAPPLLEFGGTATRKGKPAQYRPRPFMAPALQAEVKAGTIPQQWANSIRST
jgi:hypothetical protein